MSVIISSQQCRRYLASIFFAGMCAQKAGDDCLGYQDRYKIYHYNQDCYGSFCCGNCEYRYCCLNPSTKFSEDDQNDWYSSFFSLCYPNYFKIRVTRTFLSLHVFYQTVVILIPAMVAGIVGLIAFILIFVCCCVCPCCCLYKMCRKPQRKYCFFLNLSLFIYDFSRYSVPHSKSMAAVDSFLPLQRGSSFAVSLFHRFLSVQFYIMIFLNAPCSAS
uniref:Protein shisa-5 n=1 Tax=Oryzias sinensis TaxID=183150 RepID=A0A8C8E3Y4_9TELE